MSKFKVGDEVRLKGSYKRHDITEITPDGFIVLDNNGDKEYSQEMFEPKPITVYAVCDDSEGLLPVKVFMFEDNAREYARLNSPQGYSIRPFALIPINE